MFYFAYIVKSVQLKIFKMKLIFCIISTFFIFFLYFCINVWILKIVVLIFEYLVPSWIVNSVLQTIAGTATYAVICSPVNTVYTGTCVYTQARDLMYARYVASPSRRKFICEYMWPPFMRRLCGTRWWHLMNMCDITWFLPLIQTRDLEIAYRQSAWNDVRCSDKCWKACYIKHCVCA